MFRLFHRHRVRATFYHVGVVAFIFMTCACMEDIDWTHPYTLFSTGLIVIDYIAEMYDPHPDNPGPWFRSHFHRFFNDDND